MHQSKKRAVAAYKKRSSSLPPLTVASGVKPPRFFRPVGDYGEGAACLPSSLLRTSRGLPVTDHQQLPIWGPVEKNIKNPLAWIFLFLFICLPSFQLFFFSSFSYSRSRVAKTEQEKKILSFDADFEKNCELFWNATCQEADARQEKRARKKNILIWRGFRKKLRIISKWHEWLPRAKNVSP